MVFPCHSESVNQFWGPSQNCLNLFEQTKKRESPVDSGPVAKVTFVTVAARDYYYRVVRGRPNFVPRLLSHWLLTPQSDATSQCNQWFSCPWQSQVIATVPRRFKIVQVRAKACRRIGCALSTRMMCLVCNRLQVAVQGEEKVPDSTWATKLMGRHVESRRNASGVGQCWSPCQWRLKASIKEF